MRIKRQRRKLRGKYSGNCLACSAKWSKCWYIASAENQGEWESRLSKVVTPGADEVCFQCWDAKIRTSPKRKMHFKAELPAVDDEASLEYTSASNVPYLRPSKRTDRNKRRALNEDYEYTIHTTEYSPSLNDTKQFCNMEEEDEYDGLVDENDGTDSDKEGATFDEENAVILLSTAFRTIPARHSRDTDISEEDEVTDFTQDSFDDMRSKKRGAYYCGKCGKLKKGHVCNIPSPSSPLSDSFIYTSSLSSSPLSSPSELLSSPSPQEPLLTALQSAAIQIQSFQSQPLENIALPIVTVLAQPVVS